MLQQATMKPSHTLLRSPFCFKVTAIHIFTNGVSKSCDGTIIISLVKAQMTVMFVKERKEPL